MQSKPICVKYKILLLLLLLTDEIRTCTKRHRESKINTK
jgi:hypothetical protein